ADHPVVQPHDTFDHGDVRAGGAVQEEGSDEVLADEMRVEVAAGSAGGEGVVAGIDVVGTDLVARHDMAGAAQRRHETRGDGGLPVPGCRCGDDYTWNSHHSIPRWPF